MLEGLPKRPGPAKILTKNRLSFFFGGSGPKKSIFWPRAAKNKSEAIFGKDFGGSGPFWEAFQHRPEKGSSKKRVLDPFFGHFWRLFCNFFGAAAAPLEVPKNTAKNTLSPACLLDLRYGQKATKTDPEALRANFGPTWGELGANLRPTWAQLGANLGPGRPNRTAFLQCFLRVS